MLIQVYILIIAVVFGALYFFLPHLFVPSLALPVVGGILFGVIVIFVISYIVARKWKRIPTQIPSTPDSTSPRPTVCPVCKKHLSSKEEFCAECGAAIE
ncbi:MAG: hypothetical protein ACFE8F_05945 [Promethearchaeota archaeon]